MNKGPLTIFVTACLLLAGMLAWGNYRTPKAAVIFQGKPAWVELPGTVIGANSPHLIHDNIAYELFFLSLNRRGTARISDAERFSALAGKIGVSEAELWQVRHIADTYRQRVEPLNLQAKQLKDDNWPDPTPGVLSRLQYLQDEKDEIVRQVVSSLSTRLKPDTLNKVAQYVNTKVKHGIKLHQGPSTLPNGKSYPRKHH